MATTTIEQRGSPNLYKIVLLMVLLAASLAGVQYMLTHAEARHGVDGVSVRQCLSNNGTHSLWYDPQTGHWAQICNMEDVPDADSKTWGIQIVRKFRGAFEEVTSFVCRDNTCAAIEEYMIRRGYMMVD